MRLYSPIFTITAGALTGIPGSLWRESVREVWNYIDEYYSLEVACSFGTVIQISIHPNFTLEEVKRVAQAGIHFEIAMESIMSDLGPERWNYASNWAQSLDFAPSGRFRPNSIDLVETSTTIPTLADMMQRNVPKMPFIWEFQGLAQPQGTIKFYRPPPSNDVDKAIRYAEFTMCFVRAAMRCSKDELQRIPSNVRGLRWFLDHYKVPWLFYQCSQMQALWEGSPLDAMSMPRAPRWSDEQRLILGSHGIEDVDEVIREDFQRNVDFAENADGPWRH